MDGPRRKTRSASRAEAVLECPGGKSNDSGGPSIESDNSLGSSLTACRSLRSQVSGKDGEATAVADSLSQDVKTVSSNADNARAGAKSRKSVKQLDSQSDSDDFIEPPKRRKLTKLKSLAKRTMSGLSRAEKEAAAAELPVITEPQGMFTDMVSRTPGFADFVKSFKRPLRVATMCSGTESPLLALEMISGACRDLHNDEFQVEHVFSCEIEPFKQGYIERNFAPPILFRDIRELGGDKAFTAYGSLVDVPGDVDMLVAGTSCVDYSNLNNQKQDIDAKGESGQTFRGMMGWVKKHQPPIVLLENVCSAPWTKVQAYFQENGYSAQFMRVDTKQYYIPHTRTRVYLVAYNSSLCCNAADLASDWVQLVKSMERPSSSTLEAFLLPSDDPRVHRGRERLAIPKERGSGGTDWSRCESRHQRARLDENLGNKRPYTSWESQGVCKLPDYAWSDWARVQTERVLDLLDIDFLRLAAKDTDASYKTLVWNLSQNVDRTTGSVKPGICPCLTPTMVPFVTNRGGPLIGLEALSLQGIPVDNLMLTRQTEDQLADLAGNAMTCTVVGACMMSALCLAFKAKLLPKARKDIKRRVVPKNTEVQVIDGRGLLEEVLPLDSIASKSLTELLQEAERSAQLCFCEGREGMAAHIHKCQDCSATVCQKCAGRPEHRFLDDTVQRLSPQEFAATLKAALPMRLCLNGICKGSLEALKPNKGVDEDVWRAWIDRVSLLDGSEFTFRSLRRGSVWSASYACSSVSHALLELSLSESSPMWQVSVEPPTTRGALRDVLLKPVLRFALSRDGSLLGSSCEVFVPLQHRFDAVVTGSGSLVETWQASLGLKNEFEGSTRWSTWDFKVPAEDAAYLEQDVSGTYSLLEKCGHAANGLHKNAVCGPEKAPMYFFLDPSRCGGAETDHYVFAPSHRRLRFNEDRGQISALDAAWRPNARKGAQKVSMSVLGVWKAVPMSALSPVASAGAVVSKPAAPLGINLGDKACQSADVVLHCKVPLSNEDRELWPADDWGSLNLERSKVQFDQLSWLTERLSLPHQLQCWIESGIVATGPINVCQCCAPSQPCMQWVYNNGKLVAREDPQQAAEYECRIKIRPPPFQVRLKHNQRDSVGEMQVAVNARTMVNRALADLPHTLEDSLSVSWRVVPHDERSGSVVPSSFSLTSNRGDLPPQQPPHFTKYPLRPEQLRSLGWMLHQEATTVPFIEEEVSEAVLPALGWRIEGRAQKHMIIRGGVLADQVGYGKTAVTVALIDSKLDTPLPTKATAGKVSVKGTLVLVPPHLMKQWPSEIKKFTGDALQVEAIKTVGDLGRVTVEELKNADVVVVASSVLRSAKYYERLAQFSCVGEGLVKAKTPSHFADCYDDALQGLSEQVESLKQKDLAAVWRRIQTSASKLSDDASTVQLGIKRLKGKQLIAATKILEAAEMENCAPIQQKKSARAAKPPKSSKPKLAPKNGVSKKVSSRNQTVKVLSGAVSSPGGHLRRSGRKSAPPATYNPPACESDDLSEDMQCSNSISSDSASTAAALQKVSSSTSSSNAASDPWGLARLEGTRDWEKLSSPPLEMFHWARIVVDEFTYLNHFDKIAIQRGLTASARWVLSGTPPHETFDNVKGIAGFLGIHLGSNDGKPVFTKAEQTKAQTFQFYRDVHTQAWHARRHTLAQGFLDRFLRQNIAEIDEIKQEKGVQSVNLLPVEKAIYLELDHHLQALDMKNGRKKMWNRKNAGGDRVERLKAALGSSDSPEEALLKRASHFDLSGQAACAMKACKDIVVLREEQQEQCKEDLIQGVAKGWQMLSDIRKMEPDYGKNPDGEQETVSFLRWTEMVSGGDSGEDADATAALQDCLHQAQSMGGSVKQRGKKVARQTQQSRNSEAEPAAGRKASSVEDLKWELREHTHTLRRLDKELVGRVRSLRYFQAILKLSHGKGTVQCPRCQSSMDVMKDNPAVLSCCGHVGCHSCLTECAGRQECVEASCRAAVRPTSVVQRSQLAGVGLAEAGGQYGSKIRDLMKAINSTPNSDRILVFVQFKDLMQTVADALETAGINAVQLRGTSHQKSNGLESFQQESFHKGDPKVLLLNMRDESASGANLTVANHAFFVHPLLVTSQQEYDACLTQAMGRVVRYGQTKTVHIRHFLASETIDTEIFTERHRNC
mmetsp:Transcript_22634/g.62827  ORF Transcript_22634/g.62827 Transcript_22634/m.62827 type:complete len:2149 (-) Transcript_22634:730-7176(-)|eukprot:CAMPEP_0117653520 /NCGR_PEP_ID=MMETSP0804-20121206/3236_1 /TAXON_ID=1074897 /ORGANISM="Tetraselmis astigmatica, Strain CCMP880" /LENGTH=2148 /DNA_ID=CAMNT_0005459703 /DNA_START=122 /DNA_END=6568 /DNA_ORIENTATION=-